MAKRIVDKAPASVVCRELVQTLRAIARPENLSGMTRYGIATQRALGVSIPALRRIARDHRRNHELALLLWDTGIHEARILAGMVDDPAAVTLKQMNAWAADFESWDLCDQVCSNLFGATRHAWRKAAKWSRARAPYVKRAGFTLMAVLAVHDKAAADRRFVKLLPHIRREAADERNFVKKAVNWALRQIGKRNAALHAPALELAKELAAAESPAARWTGRDAVRELGGEAVVRRLQRRG